MSMHDQEGATAVEFSLIATLLFMLLFGILYFGLTYHRQQGLHAAAREGARLASLGGSVAEPEVRARVVAASPAFVAEGDLQVSVRGETAEGDATADWCEAAGDLVLVDVSLDDDSGRYQVKIPGIDVFTPRFDVTATFMCETERGAP